MTRSFVANDAVWWNATIETMSKKSMIEICPTRIAHGLQRHEAPNCYHALEDCIENSKVSLEDFLASLETEFENELELDYATGN